MVERAEPERRAPAALLWCATLACVALCASALAQGRSTGTDVNGPKRIDSSPFRRMDIGNLRVEPGAGCRLLGVRDGRLAGGRGRAGRGRRGRLAQRPSGARLRCHGAAAAADESAVVTKRTPGSLVRRQARVRMNLSGPAFLLQPSPGKGHAG